LRVGPGPLSGSTGWPHSRLPAARGSSGGCAPPPPPFNASEVSGIAYGKDIGIADTRGQIRRVEDFKGQITLVFFGFTRCPDVCPSTLMRLRQVRDALGPDADKLQVLLVSVDPERDTPDRLEAYVKNFDPSFIGLRPEPAELEKVIKAFHAIAVKVPTADGKDYTVDHSATLYIYDRRNQLRLIAQPDIAIDAFASDLRRLAQES
jgi:protein SCO1/2